MITSTGEIREAPEVKIDRRGLWSAFFGFLGSLILWIAFLVFSNLP